VTAEEEDHHGTTPGKERSGVGDVDRRILVQPEEDGGGSTEES